MTPIHPSKRDAGIDAIRGLLLVIMTLDHTFYFLLPQLQGQKLTFESLGYCSVAEGFFFLSGYAAAGAYGRKWLSQGKEAVKKRLIERVRRLYLFHLALLSLASLALPHFFGDTTHELVAAHPLREGILGFILLYQPVLLDVLPVYVLFLAAIPFILAAKLSGRSRTVIAVSASLWVAGLLYPFGRAYHGIVLTYFNPLSWQALFVLGFFVEEIAEFLQRRERLWLAVAVSVAIAGIAVRHLWGYELGTHYWLFDRQKLGPLRLLDVFALFYLIARAKPWLDRVVDGAALRPLVRLGRKSLEIYAWHAGILLILGHWTFELQFLSLEEQAALTVGILLTFAIPLALVSRKRAMSVPSIPIFPGAPAPEVSLE